MAIPSPLPSRPTVAATLTLTAVTGLVDTFSYLHLGHVFVAYMTGNVIFLGIGLRPGSHLLIAASATSAVALAALLTASVATAFAAVGHEKTPSPDESVLGVL